MDLSQLVMKMYQRDVSTRGIDDRVLYNVKIYMSTDTKRHRRPFYVLISSQTQKFPFILIQRLRYPWEALQFFAYIARAIWTIKHLTDTLAFKDKN